MKRIGNVNTTSKGSIRKFSDIGSGTTTYSRLLKSSMSDTDAQSRLQAYAKAQNNFEGVVKELKSRTRKFSGTGMDGMSGGFPDQFIDVTVTTMLKSLAGFLSVERGLDMPTMKLAFLNIVNTADDSLVSPNIGPDINLQSSKVTFPVTTPTGTSISYAASCNLIPGLVKITIKQAGITYEVKDDSKGNLLAAAGLGMTVGTVNYQIGTINVTLGTAFAPGDNYIIELAKDTPKSPINRVKGDLAYYDMTTSPEVLLQENNLINNYVAQKSMGININDVLKRRLVEEYVKLVNNSVIDPINNGYSGDVVDLDLSSAPSYDNFESYLRVFTHQLNQVDTLLTDKSWKSVNTSCYLVGRELADLFKSTSNIGSFVLNTDATYINDLVGYYNNIPVVKSNRVANDTGYAIHKTADGQMAPVARGIFLPVNDLPEVGNFNNPAQSASGIYSYEGTKLLTSELVQKFTVKMNDGFNVVPPVRP